jgi:glutamate--cysteine ligase
MLLDDAIIAALQRPDNGLNRIIRGIEKESLRVDQDGKLSMRPHPSGLGSPLTHRAITTDFSEAQLELITGIHDSPEGVLKELYDIHAFVQRQLDNELIWPNSMPCILAADQSQIPLGQYGSSNIARAKTVYRRGLGNRYGRLMQTISGIHYNFSVPEALWMALGKTSQNSRTEAYFGLIRNFRRWSWLLLYLFGAAPAVCRSFIHGLDHRLDPFTEGTYYLPYATSLRMGRLGYQSEAQSALDVSYNSLEDYAATLRIGLTESYPDYTRIQPAADGEHPQLNDAVLQIENEFYGTIRPKRTAESGERPLAALNRRGVEYVEVRCVDLNPFEPLGINLEQIRFLDTFLLLCLLADSPEDSTQSRQSLSRNQTRVVERGREPGLMLERGNGQVSLAEWADQLLAACKPIAQALDDAADPATGAYQGSLAEQQLKVARPQQTPSAKVIAALTTHGSFFQFTMHQARELSRYLDNTAIDEAAMLELEQESAASLQRQAQIEAADTLTFDEFLEGYLAPP